MNEDQREKLQLFLSRLGSVSPWRWIIIIGILIFIGVSLNMWSNYGIAIVTTPAGIDNKTPIKYLNSDDSNQNLMSIGPIVFVPRTNSAFVVSTNDYKSIVSISIPWYGITSASLPVNIANGIEKYTADSPGCANYDQENDRLIDYTCQTPTDFSTTDMKTGLSQKIVPLLTVNQSIPFMNGLLGITNNATGQLSYQDYTGIVTYLHKPEDLSISNLAASTIVTNHSSATNTSFVLLPLTGDIYIGNYANNNVTYSKIGHPKQWNTKMSSICQLLQISVYCYQGVSGAAPSNSDAQSTSNAIDGSILKIDISTPSKITVQRYSVHPSFVIDGIYIANDGNLTVTSSNQLYNFNFSGNAVEFRQLAGNIKSVASTSSSIYFAKDNIIYKLQKNTAVAVFYSDNLNIDHIFADNGSLFLAARSSKVGTEIGMFKLITTPDNNTKLLLEITTNQNEYSDDISDINFIKNTVFIRVKVTIDKQAKQADQAVNQDEYSQVKNRSSQQLQNAGLKISDLNLVFSY